MLIVIAQVDVIANVIVIVIVDVIAHQGAVLLQHLNPKLG